MRASGRSPMSSLRAAQRNSPRRRSGFGPGGCRRSGSPPPPQPPPAPPPHTGRPFSRRGVTQPGLAPRGSAALRAELRAPAVTQSNGIAPAALAYYPPAAAPCALAHVKPRRTGPTLPARSLPPAAGRGRRAGRGGTAPSSAEPPAPLHPPLPGPRSGQLGRGERSGGGSAAPSSRQAPPPPAPLGAVRCRTLPKMVICVARRERGFPCRG